VPVDTNPKTRDSRLFSSIPKFIERSLTTMVRMYAMYQPLRFFSYIGIVLVVTGAAPIVRFLFYYFSGDGGGHLQSLILGGVLVMMGFITFVVALLADLINFNRQLLEMTLERVRKMELEQDGADHEHPAPLDGAPPSGPQAQQPDGTQRRVHG
jgi:hypothetical protein